MDSPKILRSGAIALCLSLLTVGAQAVLPAETPTTAKINGPVGNHRSYVVDFNFNSMVSGRVEVIDADKQKILGMVPTGFGARAVVSHDRKHLYTADMFYSRGTRGKRTDVLTAWNTKTLAPDWEVVVPTKIANTLTERYALTTSDDDRFVYIFNFTPSSSVTVVDTKHRSVASEVDIAGCMLNYPVGNRKFFSICGNGDLQLVTLNDKGKEVSREHSHFFNPNKVKMVERAQRGAHDVYYFITTQGQVHPVDFSGSKPKFLPSWSVVTGGEHKAGWRPGGWQMLAVAPSINRLYVLMHKNPEGAHWEDPSKHIWAFDLTSHKRVATLKAPGLVWSLNATTDKQPLLLGADVTGGLEIFDLQTNKSTGVMKAVAATPTLVLGY